MPLLALGSTAIGMTLTVILLIRAFEFVVRIEPSQKAAFLAHGISQAMIATFICLPVSWGLYAASLVVFSVGAVTQPTASSR